MDDATNAPLGLRERSLGRQRLYGEEVVPQSLLDMFNKDFAQLAHIGPPGTDRSSVRRDASALLCMLVLIVEESPVPTRFWLFGFCVQALLRMKLPGLPDEIFSLARVKPCFTQKQQGFMTPPLFKIIWLAWCIFKGENLRRYAIFIGISTYSALGNAE